MSLFTLNEIETIKEALEKRARKLTPGKACNHSEQLHALFDEKAQRLEVHGGRAAIVFSHDEKALIRTALSNWKRASVTDGLTYQAIEQALFALDSEME